MSEDSEGTPAAPTCARCARTPRNETDRLAWVEIDGDDVCPGCVTLAEKEQLRTDPR